MSEPNKNWSCDVNQPTKRSINAPFTYQDRILLIQKLKEAQLLTKEQLIAVSLSAIEMIWGREVDPVMNQRGATLYRFVAAVVHQHHQHPEVIYTAIMYCLRVSEAVKPRLHLWKAGQHPLTAALCCRRMFLAAVISASKFLLDRPIPNSSWAKMVGVSVIEVSRSELFFLALIDHRLYVNQEDLYSAVCTLAKYLEVNEPIAYFISFMFMCTQTHSQSKLALPPMANT
ncbi:PHO85 cyclin-5 [Entomophthora muscae]|uniref:PHO85 cyclin-5 n=1 Tax=Entomophthora muscae TaxID=34485 RepID=A0ACC2T3W2_9FUNG|nr:PHO85 cyclin-5 [Entomophthora muscae]